MPSNRQPDLFSKDVRARRRGLFIARFLRDEASKAIYRGRAQDRAHTIICKWADLEKQGKLAVKETSLDAEFLHEVFGEEGLGYRTSTQGSDEFELIREFSVPDAGQADGAIGKFRIEAQQSPVAVIELKGASVNLDRDRSNGRTAVQQCWDYLNALPGCPWGIVSNFVTIRLYHRNKTPHAFEEFRLQELRDRRRFEDFYCLFERGGLLGSAVSRVPRAMQLLELTDNRQRDVTDELYNAYSDNRAQLIDHLCVEHGTPFETSLFIAQRLLDRIIFIAFCEDRGLLPAKCIDAAYSTVPPFAKVTNPRWRNFLNLFEAVDSGHNELLGVKDGYNGGLFRHDPQIDDLQLDDSWTNFFRGIGKYDFRDEINVDVLGNIFERSISDIEQMRLGGMFHEQGPYQEGALPAMQKSPERKRFGTYYTPPDFTQSIVEHAVLPILADKKQALLDQHGLTEEEAEAAEPTSKAAPYWRACFEMLREIKVCDPACGSGAFLIQAYDVLESQYFHIVDQIEFHEHEDAHDLREQAPERILEHNLFGVDVSPQAVEITQLALWIRSARKGVTLADLSRNIICGNSLVTDPEVHPHAMAWAETFAGVFARPDSPGFDCVIGNPPWERMKLQEREYFAFNAPEIAGAVNASTRRKKIAALETARPELFADYVAAKEAATRTLAHVRASGEFPLTAKGDINTYMLFAELAQKIVAPNGRVGLLVPSGIATDKTTKDFFAQLIDNGQLFSFLDFENKAPVFRDVHRSFKFCILVFGGMDVHVDAADFAFFLRRVDDLDDGNRRIALSGKDIALLNPNTHTCPIFRCRRDAKITKAIYRRVPVLIDETREEGGNPWGIKFHTMFHQTNDAELFRHPDELREAGFKHRGNRWTKGDEEYLPLYEAKMVQAYDHRAASVLVKKENWFRQGQTESTSLVSHQNPEFVIQPRWWAKRSEIEAEIGKPFPSAFLAFKNVTSPTNRRTMIASFIPFSGVINSAPLILFPENQSLRSQACLLANLDSLVLDYVARQKIGNVNLNFFLIKQFPLLHPAAYADRCPWRKRTTLEKWVSDRVLKLTCTANDMLPLAEAAGFDEGIHRWNPGERAELMAELDAAYFHLYGLGREDAEYILGTFRFDRESSIVAAYDQLVLAAYDALTQ